ncbi:hypothetical protein H0O03_03770 [Candidatus Micrarchaeota archaeon]|nr:hypothetical protein [Candidatus Micrarchaeota archaeon]
MAKMRGQAAIFDGIMFLMLVSFSMAMVFTFLNTYGIAQDNVIRSSHTLNYMQSVMKSIYLIDASTLAQADSNAGDCTKGDCQNETGVYGEDMNCSQLASWQVSVGDVVKKDLVDGRLDDKFGTQGAEAPGKTALRCLFREVMKPFRQAGYNYFVEVLTPNKYKPLQQFQEEAGDSYRMDVAKKTYPRPWITDSSTITGDAGYIANTGDIHGCDDPRINATSLLAVSTPFRVQPPGKDDAAYDDPAALEPYANPVGAGRPTGVINPLGYQLRVCVWPA